MKILYITQLLPFPLDAGGKIKTFSTLSALTKYHTVVLHTFIQNESDRPYGDLLKKKLRLFDVQTVLNSISAEQDRKRQLLTMFRSLGSPYPYAVFKFYNPLMKSLILSSLANSDFDAIWIDHASMTPYLPSNFRGQRILETHNAEHILYRRVAREEPRWKWKTFFFLESVKYERVLKRALGCFDTVLTISRTDSKALTALTSGDTPFHLRILPPSVRTLRVQKYAGGDGHTILFVGLLTWYPNRLGVNWFIKYVFPLIKQARAPVNCMFVGEHVRHLPKNLPGGISFVGHVTDLRPYFKQASVFIVPLFSGSGIRIKILEAMTAGVPIVSTSVGAEGIPVTHGKNIYLADNPANFAKCISLLLTEKKLHHKVSNNAKAFVRKHYNSALLDKTLKTMFLSGQPHHRTRAHFGISPRTDRGTSLHSDDRH
ncbi:glycosyltransferase [Patescibacteria group bacterium]|nr:glycosyltransferase [Patescibacteria group bacterium]